MSCPGVRLVSSIRRHHQGSVADSSVLGGQPEKPQQEEDGMTALRAPLHRQEILLMSRAGLPGDSTWSACRMITSRLPGLRPRDLKVSREVLEVA